ncbi:hypothetical protein BC828DRAFT_386317 [Blastocladiella britannica]|nr:hypothetical protein BC828DRAFT_386317 [Blastocladiella britannica]
MNPVEAHRRELKKKQTQKLKQERDDRKKAATEVQEQLVANKAEMASILELAHTRSLTLAERARKRELKQLIAAAEPATAGSAASRFVAPPQHDSNGTGGMPTGPSAFFDPLGHSHSTARLSTASNGAIGPASRSVSVLLPSYAQQPSSDSDDDDDNAQLLLPDLPDDFIPPLPPADEPLPAKYTDPPGMREIATMAGYPPPPPGGIPRGKPQMPAPGTPEALAAAASAGVVDSAALVRGLQLPTKPAAAAGAGGSRTGAKKAPSGMAATTAAVVSAAPVMRREPAVAVDVALAPTAAAGATKKRTVVKVSSAPNPADGVDVEDDDEDPELAAFMRSVG